LLLPGKLSTSQVEEFLQVREEIKNKGALSIQIAFVPLGDFQVFLNRQVSEDRAMFWNKPNAKRGDFKGRLALDLLAVKNDFSLAYRCQSQNGFQSRRLASAITTKKRCDGAPGNQKIDVLQDVILVDKGMDVLNLENIAHAISIPNDFF